MSSKTAVTVFLEVMGNGGSEHPTAKGQDRGRVKAILRWFLPLVTEAEKQFLMGATTEVETTREKYERGNDWQKKSIKEKKYAIADHIHYIIVNLLKIHYRDRPAHVDADEGWVPAPNKAGFIKKDVKLIKLGFASLENHETALKKDPYNYEFAANAVGDIGLMSEFRKEIEDKDEKAREKKANFVACAKQSKRQRTGSG